MKKIILIVILFLATGLRLWNFPLRYGLREETVRDAVIGIEAARELQLPLTGAFSSLGSFTFGPLYVYQLALATLLFKSVYSPWIYLTICSICYIAVIYKVGKILLGDRFGLLLAFLAAISPAQIISATHLTSHNLTNIFAILAIYVFLKMLKEEKSTWWGFSLGVVIGIAMNLHYQMIGLLILPLLLSINNPRSYKQLLAAASGVVVTFIPMLIFELNNHWFNVKNMADYFVNGRKRIYVPNRWLFYLRDFWPGFWADTFGVPTLFGKILMSFSGIVIVYLFIKKRLSKEFVMLCVAFTFNFILLRYYWGERFFGYLNFMRPYVFIFTAYSLVQIWQKRMLKIIPILVLIAFVYYSLPRIKFDAAPDPFSQQMIQKISLVERQTGNKKYQIYTCGETYDGGYNAETFSLAFIAELHKKFSTGAEKIGYWREGCQLPSKNKKLYPQIDDTNLLILSEATEKELADNGWQALSFSSIYDQYARWWFKLQP